MTHRTVVNYVCPVCQEQHSTQHVSSDTPNGPVTHLKLCMEHQSILDEGMVFLIEIVAPKPPKSLTYDTIERTGNYLVIDRMLANALYSADADVDEWGVSFIDEDTFEEIYIALQSSPAMETRVQ